MVIPPDVSCHRAWSAQFGGCVSLLLSWNYHHIPLPRPDGFKTHRFLLVERWVEYRPDNARGEHKHRHYRRTLNGIDNLNVSAKDFRIIILC
ncbi:hypothetical protein AHAS_Ahas06G0146300 [Arachis hypogaea]